MMLTSSTSVYSLTHHLGYRSSLCPTATYMCRSSLCVRMFSSLTVTFSSDNSCRKGFRRRVSVENVLPPSSLHGSTQHLRRLYYEKAQDDNEKEDSPETFFSCFGTKNPNAQAVPLELHQTNAQAVSDAEMLQRVFLCIVTFAIVVSLYYIWYFLNVDESGIGDPYKRPDGYGVSSAPSRQYRKVLKTGNALQD